MKIIGIAGTNGSGKDTVGQMLAERKNYRFVSVTDKLREEVKRRGLPIEREHTRMVSAEWRKQYGEGVLIIKAIEEAEKSGKDLAVASLRHPGEADEVHKRGGIVVWVDADPEIRYARISQTNRGRNDDNKTYEEFIQEEQEEMIPGGDTAGLNMSAVKEKADVIIENNGNDIEMFKNETETILAGWM